MDVLTGYFALSKEGLITTRALEPLAAQARLNAYVTDIKGSLSNEQIHPAWL